MIAQPVVPLYPKQGVSGRSVFGKVEIRNIRGGHSLYQMSQKSAFMGLDYLSVQFFCLLIYSIDLLLQNRN